MHPVRTVGVIALLAFSAAALPDLAGRAASSSDACFAALASRTAVAKSDCSSFVATTVTPCPKTVSRTVTITSTYGCPAPVITSSAIIPTTIICPVSRTPSAVPTYASSACGGSGNGTAFSSACGRLNVRGSHTTLTPGTVTTTIYPTIKVKPTFLARAVDGTSAGQYLAGGVQEGQGQNGPHDGGLVHFVGTNQFDAEYYTVDANGTLLGGGGTLHWASPAQDCYGCYFSVYERSAADGFDDALTCRLGTVLRGDGHLTLECKAPQGGARFQNCIPDSGALDLGGTPDGSRQCFVFTLGAYPLCFA